MAKTDLKDKNGNVVYPQTKTDYVFDGDGNTLEERLQQIEDGGSEPMSDDWQEDELTHVANNSLPNYGAGVRISLSDADEGSNARNYNVYSADVVEFEKIKFVASANTGAYGLYFFGNKRGFTVGAAVTAGYSGSAKLTKEVTVPEGATKIYISENTSANGEGSTKLFRKKIDGQSMASYRSSEATQLRVSTAELLEYYLLGAQKMDTYNLVQEKVGIITIGQSNADGRLSAADFPATANINNVDISLSKSITTCKIMKGSSDTSNPDYDYSASQFSAYNNSGAWAFDQVVYNAIAKALGETDFFVCKETVGATSLQYAYNRSFWPDIDQFKFSNNFVSMLYRLKKVVYRALELQPDLKFKAIIMHQGEADSVLSKTEGAYYIGLCRMIQWIRGLVGSPNLPFLFGTVPSNSNAFSQIIYNDMARCAADMENVYMIDMGEASGWHNDGLQQHFSAADAVNLADEMFKLMVSKKMLAPYV